MSVSGKPKVYQGVRVKITVKELLQQRRARQAVTDATVPRGDNGGSVQFPEPASPPCTEPYFEAEPIASAPSYFQPRAFPNCISCEENPSYLEQLFDSYLQAEPPSDTSLNAFQTSAHYNPDIFQPAPLSYNQSLVPGSPDSPDLSSPLDYTYSPPQLPPFAPLNYSTPSPLDTKNYGYPGEEWAYHAHPHPQSSCSPSACYCTSCGSEHLESIRVSEYYPYPSTDCMDYLPPATMADDFFRRDRSCDICYS
ncbi:POU class 2 homeobox associating factor 3 [Alligator mississippiensis]|uniref:POU class 2 homeobox associating factor 3 n=1 Tax=Alligator mississippiensis TaxID=8496 RepID=UPI0028773FC4|nr:POU class 2 homeobox associating factor 3 [Alligator mississippiensis]